MKKLIADSGSTKTDWALIEDGKILGSFKTRGLNPFFTSKDEFLNTLKEKIIPETKGNVDEIFFYGAGITDKDKKNEIEKPLSLLFPNSIIEIRSDLLGASRALFGNEAGIVCILGTGSNREIMPLKLRKLFEEDYTINLKDVLKQVYKENENPAKYLSLFTPFLSKNIADPYCQQILKRNTINFFEKNVLTIPSAKKYPIGFIGSIAYYFSDFIVRRACEYGFSSYRIEKEPINGLVKYHKN